MFRWHLLAFAFLFLLSSAMAQASPSAQASPPAQPNPSAQASPFLRFDGLTIYFGNQSNLSIFSCVDGQCHPGFGSMNATGQRHYISQGFPIQDSYVELKVNYSLDSAPPCAIKLVSSHPFDIYSELVRSQMSFSSGNYSYGLSLVDNQSVPVRIAANGTQLCITPNASSGLIHLYLIPFPPSADEQAGGNGIPVFTPPASPPPAPQAFSSFIPSNSSNSWVSEAPKALLPVGPVLGAAGPQPQPQEKSAPLPLVFIAVPLLAVLAALSFFLSRKPKRKREEKIILPDLS